MTFTSSKTPIVELQDISKEFKGNYALQNVSLKLFKGEIHGLLGENGAGKSTLIKILTGVYTPSAGAIKIAGKEVVIKDPLEAHREGIGAVYQDAELVGSFTVAENLVLGQEPGGVFVNKRKLRQMANALLKDVGVNIEPDKPAYALSAAEMQLVILATLFHRKYKVLVLDEPTARLSASESAILFELIDVFRKQGVTIIYISHRLAEIKRLCDRVTVLRGGKISGTREREQISEEEITRLMIDQEASQLEVINPGLAQQQELLRVSNLRTARLKGINFTLHRGEVLGITGPVGGGMEDVGTALAGLTSFEGSLWLGDRQISVKSPAAARAAGIALIPEDRRRQALFNDMSVGFNVCIPALRTLVRWGLVKRKLSDRYAWEVVERLDVRPTDPNLEIKFLSGGNQQKAVIGKWLEAGAKLYIFIEPTAGVDVGAIKEIYQIILDMARRGAAVIVVSSAIKEILALSQKTMVIQNGEEALFKDTTDTKYNELLTLAMGKTAA